MDQKTRQMYRFVETEDRIRIYNPYISLPKEGLQIITNDVTIEFQTDSVTLLLCKTVHEIHMVVW